MLQRRTQILGRTEAVTVAHDITPGGIQYAMEMQMSLSSI